jgi:hypothetical protein
MSCHCNKYSDDLTTFSDVKARCDHSVEIETSLEKIATDQSGWTSVFRCRLCQKIWAREYPFGEMQGGGPSCYYQITTSDPKKWLEKEAGLVMKLRDEQEDRDFMAVLGEEIGPETCCHTDCTHKRIRYSMMCREHHFLMIRNKPYQYPS